MLMCVCVSAYVCVSMFVCVCVCVRERERESECVCADSKSCSSHKMGNLGIDLSKLCIAATNIVEIKQYNCIINHPLCVLVE